MKNWRIKLFCRLILYFWIQATFNALFNTRDQWHQKAVQWQQQIALENPPLLTTEFVLTEIANGLSAVKFREDAGNIIHILQDDDLVQIIPATSELFSKGLNLYENRNDKDWGLTDCISFVVMQEKNVTNSSPIIGRSLKIMKTKSNYVSALFARFCS